MVSLPVRSKVGPFRAAVLAGDYQFTGMDEGSYTVAEVVPAAHDQTSPAIRSGGSGELTFAGAVKDGQNGVDGLDAAHSVTLSPDGPHVYGTGSLGDPSPLPERP